MEISILSYYYPDGAAWYYLRWPVYSGLVYGAILVVFWIIKRSSNKGWQWMWYVAATSGWVLLFSLLIIALFVVAVRIVL